MGLIKNYGTDEFFGASKVLGTQLGASGTTVNFTGDAIDKFLNDERLTSVPSSATDTALGGEIAIDANYAYFAIGVNSWARVAIAAW
jgi:hypothetical protein